MNKHYYHFVDKTLRDGSPIPPDGEWLSVKGKLEMCKRGLHASAHVADALKYAPGATLCLVELDGEILKQDDKVCASKRKIIARFDATELLRADARASALSVAHLWEMPAIVRQYLETGEKSIRIAAASAASAAAAAAYVAAAYAANAARAAAAYVDACAACAANAANAADAASYAAARVAAAYAADAANAATTAASCKVSRARLKRAVTAKFKEIL
jgi:hypothetical protein